MPEFVGRPYEIFREGHLIGGTRDYERALEEARKAARENPGQHIRVVDEWCDTIAYHAKVNPETGRLWATARN